VFHSLAKPELLQIVDLEVDKVLARIKAKDVHIDLQQSAKEFLIEKGYDPQYGARPMRRAVERFLEDPLAEELLRGNVKPGDRVDVVAAVDKLSFQVPEAQTQSSAPAAPAAS
jgi:ATP-dependent Clp protease ATP-binding subunit ClpC